MAAGGSRRVAAVLPCWPCWPCWRPALLLALLVLLAAAVSSSDDWTQCPAACKCKWVSGKKAAECTSYDLTAVPRGLSPELQSVDLSNNPLQLLPRDAFRDVGLVNLHKLFLRDCGIRELHQEAFSGLEILIELDLTANQIHTLHPGTFRDNVRLRLLYLNRNPISSLPDGIFNNMTFLQTVELSECQLTHVGHHAFQNVPNLQHLKLDGNRLQHLQLQAVEPLARLVGLVLHNNPWRCDCHLRPLRDWAMERKLYTKPTACAEPHKLHRKLWSELGSEEFACRPQIMAPPLGTVLEADADEVTLSCKVNGNPAPEVQWVFNSRVITNNSRSVYGDHRYVVLEGPVDGAVAAGGGQLGATVRWVNLTIRGVRQQDRGQFVCVAQSGGGVDERNVTLKVSRSFTGGGFLSGGGGGALEVWQLIAWAVAGVVLLLLAVVLLCCCLARRRRDLQRRDAALVIGKKPPPEGRSPNGDVTHHVRADGSEQQKSLLTMVNPVQKPPRRYDHPSGQGGTELSDLSELNRNLLDDGSIYASHVDDEGRSLDSVGGGLTPQRNGSEAEGPAAAPASTNYPPDLLAFPSRSVSVSGGPHSPASTASTALCGTLPYSRSQSPFSPPLSQPLVQPRSGYVTIPRRPRVPSWSSPTPTPCLDDQILLKLEPVYDNMGPRTTADGSSVLSLNKTGLDASPVRAQAPTPAPRPAPLPAYYAPIEELDPAPVRTNGQAYGQTNGHHFGIGRQATASPSPSIASSKFTSPAAEKNGRRGSWARISPESSGTLGRPSAAASRAAEDDALLMPGTVKRPTSIASISSANSTTPLTNGSAGAAIVRTKVPPKPPPKPKKKVGPLFEDEGEDGTEV
ncbi:Peroxidasin [Frankliniella fusca]|uniref:Peroxidasin n=1 Tax=Frankliniella fusca TaxID=407009 RepID=A0AAE1HBW9_9NEOP|nr:Peroxidasin [Frankliniella fusca]